MNLLDFIFPKRCVNCAKQGEYLCENCFAFLSFDVKNLCLICDKPTFNNLTHSKCLSKYSIDGTFSALTYNKITHKLIYNFKYKPYLKDLTIVLTDLFYESIIQNENFNKELKKSEWMIVPIPLSNSKLKKRGYNQAEIIAWEIAKKLNIPIQKVLQRVRDTKTHVGMSNVDRKLNIKNAFMLTTKYLIRNTNVVLVDDVVTTGSTLKEAAKVLKKEGAKRVIGLTLARD